MILPISLLFLIPFPFLYLFFPFIPLSFLSTVFLYNLYLNPNLLKILSNYTYTIPKVTTLHTYILTSCLYFLLRIFTFPTFPSCIFFLLSYFSYTLFCCAQTDLTVFGYFILPF